MDLEVLSGVPMERRLGINRRTMQPMRVSRVSRVNSPSAVHRSSPQRITKTNFRSRTSKNTGVVAPDIKLPFKKSSCACPAPMQATGNFSESQLFRLFLAIDNELIQQQNRVASTALSGSETQQLTDLLNELVLAPEADAISALQILENPEQALSGLSGRWSNFWNKAKNVGAKVVNTAKTVVKKAATAAKKAVNFVQTKAAGAALKVLKRKPDIFAYALLDKNSPLLTRFPVVAQKAAKQRKAIEKVGKVLTESYVYKYLRAEFIKAKGQTPEQWVAGGKNGLSGTQLGEPTTLAVVGGIIASLAIIIPSVVSVIKKEDAPQNSDFGIDNGATGDGGAVNSGGGDFEPYNGGSGGGNNPDDKKMGTGTIIAISAASLLVVGGGIYMATK